MYIRWETCGTYPKLLTDTQNIASLKDHWDQLSSYSVPVPQLSTMSELASSLRSIIAKQLDVSVESVCTCANSPFYNVSRN
jgi:hypothetical protein